MAVDADRAGLTSIRSTRDLVAHPPNLRFARISRWHIPNRRQTRGREMLSRLAPTLSIEPLASRTLAKSLAFPDSVKDVSIVREGKRRVIVPSNAVWDGFLIALASTFPHAINQPFRIANRPDAAASCRYSCDARARRSNDWRGRHFGSSATRAAARADRRHR